MKKTVDLFKKIVKQSLMPFTDQTVSEWADSYRMISGEAAAEPGRWRTDRAPTKSHYWMLLLNQA